MYLEILLDPTFMRIYRRHTSVPTLELRNVFYLRVTEMLRGDAQDVMLYVMLIVYRSCNMLCDQ